LHKFATDEDYEKLEELFDPNQDTDEAHQALEDDYDVNFGAFKLKIF